MSHTRRSFCILIFLFLFSLANIVSGFPSGREYPPTFDYRNGYWFDSWDFNRNVYWGENGYLPNIAYESLGSERELAYSLGLWFMSNYPQRVERAEAILDYVQRWTDYGYDADNVVRDDVPQEEWAWNADEMAHMFNETQNKIAIGDCEDMSFLCATLYVSAGFDVALVSPAAHVALLIWLPEYDNANYYWDIPDDDREYGWIWVEATGEANPLGWTPPDYSDGDWISYILSISGISVEYSPKYPQAEDEVKVQVEITDSFGTVNEVSLEYSIDNVNIMLEMEKTNSFYEATIPKQPEGTKVICKVSVIGPDNLIEEYDFEYQVGSVINFSFFTLEIVVLIFALILIFLFLSRIRNAY